MGQYFQNNSCSPFLAPNGTCDLGNLAQYAINVSDWRDVAAGIEFARAQNIRLIVKNTGHDGLGRSSGKGSLALWTHNLKSMSFISNYSSVFYSGPAARVGAGVEVLEIYEAASAHGYRVVGGGCPTVGLAGGWLPGGGHGPLSSSYGLGADSALEYEVVTLDGRHDTASPSHNADLYWALTGGGGGTYAIVLSLTLRTHRDGPVVGTEFSFANTNPKAYWAAVEAWARHVLMIEEDFPKLQTSVTFNNQFFQLAYATLPDATSADKMNAALDPFFYELASLNISLAANTTVLSRSFVDHYNAFPGSYVDNLTLGNRLIPRDLVQNPKRLSALIDTVRTIATNNSESFFIITAANVSTARVGIDASVNSVLPAWRDSAFLLNFGIQQAADASWAELQRLQTTANGYITQFRALTPGGGTYPNEGSFNYAFWKTDYYGANYGRLLSIKKRYDPDNMLWGSVNVGGDLLTVAADGRLCKARGS
ncbi:FAD-binding domain-containing protein [Xylariaceae sp. FL1651]|nr:FAD-binding domain-containing protein [Xylariaceae sp. FL1651]